MICRGQRSRGHEVIAVVYLECGMFLHPGRDPGQVQADGLHHAELRGGAVHAVLAEAEPVQLLHGVAAAQQAAANRRSVWWRRPVIGPRSPGQRVLQQRQHEAAVVAGRAREVVLPQRLVVVGGRGGEREQLPQQRGPRPDKNKISYLRNKHTVSDKMFHVILN